MTTTLHLLCAGAAQGLVKALQPAFAEATGATVTGRFGAVGAMKEALLAGEPCDLMIVTDAMVGELAAADALRADTRRALGRVRTGIAVRRGEPHPDVSTPESPRDALRAADAIYFPDPQRATAGIHFAHVMRELGVHDDLTPRFRTFPNGATAMRQLAASDAPRTIGCTQVTEILYADGVDLVGALPARFELATVYSGAVATRAAQPALAARLLDLLAGDDARALRAAGGFET
ncbi:molybdate ABC transporter substrate-binding protein [Azohydromonas sediminis]|uniref:molybdate ABC transporter substrate-binding protein n=1 Tax=Azohydromonas sediminis TaxID=2259674 RepID=UPI000E6532A3|nr:substrate-binding domain-containing protein [Azohydromonas sediminis]